MARLSTKQRETSTQATSAHRVYVHVWLELADCLPASAPRRYLQSPPGAPGDVGPMAEDQRAQAWGPGANPGRPNLWTWTKQLKQGLCPIRVKRGLESQCTSTRITEALFGSMPIRL